MNANAKSPGAHRFAVLRRVAPLLAVALLALRPHAALANPAVDYKLAVGYYNTDKFAEAAEYFRKFLAAAPKNDPDVPTARFFLGLSLVNEDEFDEARQSLRLFVRDNEKNRYIADARYNVGWCSYRLGKHQDAVRDFISFLNKHEKHPNAEFALVYLGDSYLQLDRSEDASRAFRSALERFPRGTMAEDAHMGLARAYELEDELDSAIAEYREVLKNPRGARLAEAQFELAGRLYDAKQYRESAVEYDAFATAHDKSPLVPTARLNGGFAYFKVGDFAAARKAFDAAAQNEDLAIRAGYWSGVCSKSAGDYDEASKVFATAFEKGKDAPFAPRLLYQWADSEYLAGRHAEASKRFAQLSDTWPKDDLGDDALHEAGNAALRAGEIDRAIELVTLFEKRYGKNNPFSARQQLLAGRIELNRRRAGDVDTAVKRFEAVLRKTKDPDVARHARYELARARYEQGKNTEAVAALKPILPEIEKEGTDSPFVEAFLLNSDAQLALGEYAKADAAAAKFLEFDRKDPRAGRAYANRAVALAHLKDRRQSDLVMTQLALVEPDSKLLLRTRYEVAEAAMEAEDYPWASAAYQSLAKNAAGTSYESAALSGLGWSLYKQKEYAEAAKAFQSFVAKFGDDAELGTEARYMLGKSLQDDGQAEAAAKAFQATFEQSVSKDPAPAGAESKGPQRFVFLAGLQAARAYKQSGDVKNGDAAYEKLAKAFPKAAEMDALLDEWALLNYEADQHERADELFARLVRDHPGSKLADDARFHLAESEYIGGDVDKAFTAFEKLAKDARSDDYIRERSLFHLVEIEVARKNWQEVLKRAAAYRAAHGDSERSPFVAFRAGEAELALGRFADARKTLEAIRARHTSGPVTKESWYDRMWILIAEAALETKDYTGVEKNVDDLRQRSPKCPFLYRGDFLVGRVRLRQADFEKARASFARVLADANAKNTETAAKAQLGIADSFIRQNDFKNAQREYFKVYVLYDFPKWQGTGLYNSGLCDENLKKFDDAAKAYEDLLEKFPKSEHVADARKRLAAIRQRTSS